MPIIPLPLTLAAINRNGAAELNLPWDDVAVALRGELPTSAIPMEAYLERGGWPEFTGIEVRGVRNQAKHVEVLLTLRFIEHTPAACPSSSRPEIRIAYIKAVIDKSSGLAELADDA